MASAPLLIIGCGASGLDLAQYCLAQAHRPVIAHCRRIERAATLEAQGLTVWRQDLDQADGALPILPSGGDLVWLAPPPRQGDEDSRLRQWLPRLLAQGRFRRLLYASTTGVYGSQLSGWVDETGVTEPDSERGRRRLDAEQVALTEGQRAGVDVIRLRIAGIYGPGRLPRARLEAGRPITPELAARPGNRIHQADLVISLYQALIQGRDGAVYNVADGYPAPFGDYLDACADALGLARLPRDENAGDDPAAAFLARGRRVDNRRLREELGVCLRYPDFHQGIEASLAKGDHAD
ncbi:hypothetical protein J2T60_002125 [Natronospira proteinivora]|uniref:Nucleoside-diphosphate-sugar epimerase n=1 Tax=Natronospira proteinivora TaxID=1807133 RepID=A0ABT1GB36_9GAMM|nr:SDR family NAD(P)-dependent oxidoreductase [Natronospira proteinivora]MCP1728125.1 hypothetical protein [Natronospira proteinivora]